ncbi:MAG: GNAT family N-acetyltransferase [Candidatus Thorarchaeota archaeon]
MNLDSVSEFIYGNKVGIYRSVNDAESIKTYLARIQERFPSEVVFQVMKGKMLCGWMTLGRETETVAEFGRWQPIVKKDNSEDQIANLLLQHALKYAEENGIVRIEGLFNGVDEITLADYYRSSRWFISIGFPKLEDSGYMLLNLTMKNIERRGLPEGFTVVPVEDVDETKIYDCYYNSFADGEDREFLDMEEEQRKERYVKSVHNEKMNPELSSVLRVGQEIIGFAFVLDRGDEQHIDRFGILGEYRGRGLAKSYLLYLMKLAEEQGHTRLSLGVDLDNTSGLNLYKNVGFELHSRTIIHSWNKK